jgi:hypothetical protein
MAAPSRAAPRILDLVLTLDDAPGSVWRRVRISAGATLARAQRVFCVSMGWKGGRPYAFSAGHLRYESAASGHDDVVDVRLRQLLPDSGTALDFEYGDLHRRLTVRVERVLPPDGDIVTPRCLGGEGAATLEGPPTRLGFSVDVVNAELERLR